jgi:transposase
VTSSAADTSAVGVTRDKTAMGLWNYGSRGWAKRGWDRWYQWAIRSRLEPIKAVARMVKSHLDGILTAVVEGVTNAMAEGVNSVIQRLKFQARGYRNRGRFRNAIYFHYGDLDLYPAALGSGSAVRHGSAPSPAV